MGVWILCISVAFGIFFSIAIFVYRRDEFGQWTFTFVATLISVGAAFGTGVLLYNYTGDQNRSDALERFCSGLQVELSHKHNKLQNAMPLTIIADSSDRKFNFFLVQIEPLIIREAITSGLFPIDMERKLIILNENISTYKLEIDNALSLFHTSNRKPNNYERSEDKLNESRLRLIRQTEMILNELEEYGCKVIVADN
jgi:hypothetical protein